MAVHLDHHWPLTTVISPKEKALIKEPNLRLPTQNPRKPFVPDVCPEHRTDRPWQKGIFVDTYI